MAEDQVNSVVPIVRFGWALFSNHLSRPEMPMLIHRDKSFLEKYAAEHLHHAYVPWDIRQIKEADTVGWFKP